MNIEEIFIQIILGTLTLLVVASFIFLIALMVKIIKSKDIL